MMMSTKLKPMSLAVSIAYFGAGAILFFFTQHYLAQYLADLGLNSAALFLFLAWPHLLFFCWALIAYRMEGNPWEWKTFCERFRIHKIRGRLWWWVIVFVVVDVGLYLLVYTAAFPVVKWLHDLFPEPAIIKEVFGDGTTFAGYPMLGNWWLLGLYFIVYFFNVLGEEFLWRGYILPRQELTHGRYTWIVHGLLWTSFHLFAPYNALMVLPGALFMSFIVLKYRNTTIFIISHATLNGLAMIRIINGIIG